MRGTCNESVIIPAALTQITLDGGGSARVRGLDIAGRRNGVTVLRGASAVIGGNENHDKGSLDIPGSGLGINVVHRVCGYR